MAWRVIKGRAEILCGWVLIQNKVRHQMRHPHVRAEVSLFATSAGGRSGPTPEVGRYGCPMNLDGEYFDAFFDLAETGPISPGQTVTASMAFLSPELVIPRMAAGKRFSLWEGKMIALGRVLSVHPDA